MLISIPPKYAVAQVIGFIKGKTAIHIARAYMGRRRNFTGQLRAKLRRLEHQRPLLSSGGVFRIGNLR